MGTIMFKFEPGSDARSILVDGMLRGAFIERARGDSGPARRIHQVTLK